MTMSARLVYQRSEPPPLWRRIGNGIMIVIHAFIEAYHLRKSIRALEKLDDRMLADIGVTRSGIEAAVRDGERKTSPVPQVAEATAPMAKAA
jgi:uncharacterized protein YjiS (DUF1127 family)